MYKKKIILLLIFISIVIISNTDTAVGKTEKLTTSSIKDIQIIEDVSKHTKKHINNCVEEFKEKEYESHWESIGYVRCTEYCTSCNSPSGHNSSTGVYLTDGHVACSWLPLGTKIRINGYEFTVVDRCGTDAIDIFRDRGDGCYCNMNEYKEVEIYNP